MPQGMAVTKELTRRPEIGRVVSMADTQIGRVTACACILSTSCLCTSDQRSPERDIIQTCEHNGNSPTRSRPASLLIGNTTVKMLDL
jgi:hypothetical protein